MTDPSIVATHIPRFRQQWRTSNDRSGTRGVFVIFSEEGRILDSLKEGNESLPAWVSELTSLGMIEVTVPQYRAGLKMRAVKR